MDYELNIESAKRLHDVMLDEGYDIGSDYLQKLYTVKLRENNSNDSAFTKLPKFYNKAKSGNDIKKLLGDFVETAVYDNSLESAYKKFPEFKDYDMQLLGDYVQTAVNYNSNDSAFVKFPEFHNSEDKGLTTGAKLQKQINGIPIM